MIDPKEIANLKKTLDLYAQATGKDLVEVVNRAGRQVAIFATNKTPKADPAKIDRVLRRHIGHQIVGKSGKRFKKAKKIYEYKNALAGRIILKRAKERNESLSDDEVEKRAKAMIAGRKRAVAFIRSGYVPAIKAFGGKLRGNQRGKPKGSGSVATERRIVATITNNVQGRKGGAAVKVGQAALNAAVREVEADMRSYAQKKIDERTAKANAAR